jgi:hypothetical protein
MLRLRERKQKRALLEQELMRECTFTPITNSAKWQAGQTPPWERLHRRMEKKESSMTSSFSKPFGSGSPDSRDTTSSGSSGIDDGRRKRQNWDGKTNKKEGEDRRRRFEDLQRRHCALDSKLSESMKCLSSIRCELFPPSVQGPEITRPQKGTHASALRQRLNENDVVFGMPQRTGPVERPPRIFDSGTSPLRHLIAFAASSNASPLRKT